LSLIPLTTSPTSTSADPPVTRDGETWVLSKGKLTHKLQCGDARLYEPYTSVMGDELAEVVITAPRYDGLMTGGKISIPELANFLQPFVVSTKRCLKAGAVVYIFMEWAQLPALWEAANPEFGSPRNLIVWVKSNAGKGGFYRQQHELISVYVHGDHAAINNFKLGHNGRFRSDVWQYPASNSSGPARDEALAGHRPATPVALVADALRDCSSRGGLVLDPFGGSGTTLIAAQKAGRQARLIELDPSNCDVIVRRWQHFTKENAVLAGSGKTFDQIQAERADITGGCK
jgi:DNA modification methylase